MLVGASSARSISVSVRKKSCKTVGELPKVCFQIALKCLHLPRTGRPDILRLCTNWPVQSRNGQELVTNAKPVQFPTITTRATASNTVMWVILLTNADWRYLKTQTLFNIPKVRNRPGGASCAFSGVERWYLLVGCAQSKLQSHTVHQKHKLCRWTQGYTHGR